MSAPLEIIAVPGETTFTTRRTFAAPRELVFEAHVNPEHLRRWWGPHTTRMVSCELDLRVGGAWRFVLRDTSGQVVGFRGEYFAIDRPERLGWTFIYEPLPQYVSRETAVFEERDGRTIVTCTVVHDSVEARDGQLNSGMEAGMRETYERLDDLLGELSATA